MGSKRKYCVVEPIAVPESGYFYSVEHKRQGSFTFYVSKVNDQRWIIGDICSKSGTRVPTTLDIKQILKIEKAGES